ncbi:DUF4197 domain-containing protein, partial [Desulfoluna sp.]|uniref:DUF4197 domain-containing protein n=1 Tax=Desulfoluna sp. TaxID=2045199 RepID=UPI00261EB8E9
MKRYGMVLCAVWSLFVWWPDHVVAEGSWWDKGVNMIKGTSDDKAPTSTATPDQAEIGNAFKEALRLGTEQVVQQLGVTDGFNKDPAIHIPLPAGLSKAKTMVSKMGMSHMVDDLELKLNRAAEAATPKAKTLFLQAIKEMTFDDVMAIYKGPEDSATKYFEAKMSPPLKEEMRPVVDTSLSEVGAIQAYDKVVNQYKT